MSALPCVYLDAEATARRLPMTAAIAAMRAAFADDVENPQRVHLARSLFMTARVGTYTGIKVVSTQPGKPVGSVTVYGPDGAPLGWLDGATVTSIRTGAASGLATDLLAQQGAASLAMLGAGAMSLHQVEAVLCVRPVRQVRVWSRQSNRAEALAAAVARQHPGVAVHVVPGAEEAVTEADIVCCATPARAPIFAAEAARPGTHINAVGAYTPNMVEVPAALVRRARVVVESRAAAAHEAGDLLQAGHSPDAELADLLAGRWAGRENAEQITLFKSVGVASQDVAAAVAALCGVEALAPQKPAAYAGTLPKWPYDDSIQTPS